MSINMKTSIKTFKKSVFIAHNITTSIKQLVPCHIEWLPEESAHLARFKIDEKPKKIWWPENENGEPHDSNPDDGCGGAKYKLTTVYNYDDGPTKVQQKADNYKDTAKYYREAHSIIRLGTMSKEAIWLKFQAQNDLLVEPSYSLIGRMWRKLFGIKIRIEEEEMTSF